MDISTYDYLKPTDKQTALMQEARAIAKGYAFWIENNIPDGADRTYLLRKLREVAMWANVAITRNDDGSPRQD